MPACLSVDNVPVPSAYVPLWFHIRGLQETATALEYRGVETDVSPWTFRPYYIFSLHAFETE